MLRTLHSLLNCPVGRQWIHKDRRCLLSTMENGATSTPAQTNPGHERERKWAYISDATVRLTTLEEVFHSKAYTCMYERV